jgi:hypothetical protein
MRLFGLGLLFAVLGAAKSATAQVPVAPAPEPATPAGAATSPAQPAAEPAPPAPPVEPAAPPAPPDVPPPESAPAPEKTPETALPPSAVPPPRPESHAPEVAPQQAPTPPPAAPPWVRAHSPLTLEGRLGLLLRPDSGAGFQDETHAGADLGLSLYMDLKPELAAGLEIERTSLGRGTSISGLDSVSVDYTVSSAMLGVRAYPKRTELFDVFVGLQIGVGIQGVSATGTANNGALSPASPYSCGASDAPALQIGGGIGARLMFTPRWGVSARINGTGRRLSGDMVEQCAQGLGSTTTVTGSLGIGYDFDLDP